MQYHWVDLKDLSSFPFICGHCGNDVSSEKGYTTAEQSIGDALKGRIYICHRCTKPTFFAYDSEQFPGPAFGDTVKDIVDPSVAKIYDEARRCVSASAFTAAVLACRKLLMHIAVAKGAEEGKSFAYYVSYLAQKNYVPPDAVAWVDHIREKGNEANHEIKIVAREDAEELLSFSSMLLKVIYEFPAAVRKKTAKKG